jgi:hypothetical protein
MPPASSNLNAQLHIEICNVTCGPGNGASRVDVHEIPQQRIDLVVPALAREHAVMSDTVVDAAIGAHAGAKVLCRERLAAGSAISRSFAGPRRPALGRGMVRLTRAGCERAFGPESFRECTMKSRNDLPSRSTVLSFAMPGL